MKKSFTILELIFVIVIIGILAGLAIPRLFPVIDTAKVKKAQSQLSAIRAAISNAYSKNIMSGNDTCPELEGSDTNKLFENVLSYPISKDQKDIKWEGNGTDYNFTIGNMYVKFKYDKNTSKDCKFECIEVNTTDGSTPEYNCADF